MERPYTAPRLIAAALCVAAVAPAAASAGPPRIEQLVAFKNGDVRQKAVTAKKTTVKLSKHKRCAIPSGTALAALLLSKVATVKLHDYGSCGKHSADAGGLYVRQLRGDKAKGQDGWVYKVGNKLATAGSADPSGPFGNGRLKNGARVTWFYCRMDVATASCQPTLVVKPKALGGGQLRVTVRAYDDRGHATPAAGATVKAAGVKGVTGADGTVTLTGAARGATRAFAVRGGSVRSFGELVDVT